MSLPTALTRHFEASVLRARSPAWFEIDADGRVASRGGDLPHYGLERLEPGEPVEAHADFLLGCLPLARGDDALPMVQMPSGETADVHLFGEDEHGWVLLLSSDRLLGEETARQQSRLEMNLEMRKELERDTRGLADALGVLVLARLHDDSFRAVAKVPGWARVLWPRGERHRVEDVFPYIESFLQEAEDIWTRRRAGMLRSGPWTQEGQSGTELHLEATATCLPPMGDVLMIELLGDRYWERQRVLQLARERRLALDELRQQQDQREILLHCIVHDLKGPLAGIQGSVDLLASDPEMPEDLRELLGTAKRACGKQLGLIEDIVSVFRHDASKPDSGIRPALTPPFDFVEFTSEVHQDFQPSFAAAGRTLRLELPAHDRVLPVRADKRRIERVFANLLENAQRHTPLDGKAILRVAQDGDQVTVCIENDGKGVPPELQDSLFDQFVRGGEGGGTAGLGLYYCSITVKKFGGRIRYDDRPGGGAMFTFTLPLAEDG